jgi:hypothetical protein
MNLGNLQSQATLVAGAWSSFRPAMPDSDALCLSLPE